MTVPDWQWWLKEVVCDLRCPFSAAPLISAKAVSDILLITLTNTKG